MNWIRLPPVRSPSSTSVPSCAQSMHVKILCQQTFPQSHACSHCRSESHCHGMEPQSTMVWESAWDNTNEKRPLHLVGCCNPNGEVVFLSLPNFKLQRAVVQFRVEDWRHPCKTSKVSSYALIPVTFTVRITQMTKYKSSQDSIKNPFRILLRILSGFY